jgi:hypothetical protein
MGLRYRSLLIIKESICCKCRVFFILTRICLSFSLKATQNKQFHKLEKQYFISFWNAYASFYQNMSLLDVLVFAFCGYELAQEIEHLPMRIWNLIGASFVNWQASQPPRIDSIKRYHGTVDQFLPINNKCRCWVCHQHVIQILFWCHGLENKIEECFEE